MVPVQVCLHNRALTFYIAYMLFLPRFSRGSVQTVLPPNKKLRAGRLCGSFDDQIRNLDQSKSNVQKEADQCRKRKRDSEASLQHLQHGLKIMKV